MKAIPNGERNFMVLAVKQPGRYFYWKWEAYHRISPKLNMKMFFCALCEKLLIGISTLQEKLLIAKEDVAKKVSNLHRIKRPSESEIPSPRQVCNRPLIQPPSLQQQPSLPAASSNSAGRTGADSPNVKVKVIVATNFACCCFFFSSHSCRLLFHTRIDKTSNEVIVELSRKIKCEMKQFSSLDFDSVLNS